MKGGVRGPPRRRRRGCCRRATRRRRAADKPGQRRHGDADGDKDRAVRREAPVRWPQPALQQTQSSQVAGADASTEEAGAHDDPVSTGVTWRRGSNIDSTRNAPSSPTTCTRGNPHDESRLKWLGSSRNAPRRCCRCVRRRRCHRPWLRFMVLSNDHVGFSASTTKRVGMGCSATRTSTKPAARNSSGSSPWVIAAQPTSAS